MTTLLHLLRDLTPIRASRWGATFLLAGCFAVGSVIKAEEPNTRRPDVASAQPDPCAMAPSDPCDPCTAPDPNTVLPPAPDLQADPNTPEKAIKPLSYYWTPAYHRQVSERVFALINYPYHQHGRSYADDSHLQDLLYQPDTTEQPDPCQAISASADPCTPETSETIAPDPNRMEATETDDSSTPMTFAQLNDALEECCSIIHEWRSLNESPAVTREILYAIELTRTEANVYEIAPQLAVAVRRTVGRIAATNTKFDLTSRALLRSLLQGRFDQTLQSRMEKHLSDLQLFYDRLAEQNDAISTALGVGKLPHGNPQFSDEPIDFTGLSRPAPY